MKKLVCVTLFILCIVLTGCQNYQSPIYKSESKNIQTVFIQEKINEITAIDKAEKIIPEEKQIIPETKNKNSTVVETTVVERTAPKLETITVSFVGDVMLGSYKGQKGNKLFGDYFNENGYTWPFDKVRDIFEKDDITFANLECALTNQVQTAVKTYPIKGCPEYVDCLVDGNIEVVNIANNHIYDCNRLTGLNDTVNILTENNIGVTGEGEKFYTDVKGAKFCFLGYRSFAVNKSLKKKITKDINEARENGADVVIVEFHGGTEKVYTVDPEQNEITRYAVDAGADVVVSAHPHVIHGFEIYNGKVIAHSMGNFVIGSNCHPKDYDSYIYQQEFIFNPEDKSISYGESIVIPCRVSSDQKRNNFQPMVLEGEEAERVIEKLKDMSSIYDDTIPMLK